jgi:hypothetical protein
MVGVGLELTDLVLTYKEARCQSRGWRRHTYAQYTLLLRNGPTSPTSSTSMSADLCLAGLEASRPENLP